ncbi:MAG: ZIP family metal transporter [Planctomycetota bacterium]|jgi:zinc and cadmium transporter
MALLYSIIATGLISLVALIGIFFVRMREETMKKIIFVLVALATGGLMGGAFLHLIPKALEQIQAQGAVGHCDEEHDAEDIADYHEAHCDANLAKVGWMVLAGFVLFFLLERIIRWRHCHGGVCDVHPVSYLSLIGDGIHNFFDGIVIAGAFLINMKTGIVTSVVILAHEIPQEIGDYGILIHSGMSPRRALVLNLLTALTAIIGAVLGYFAFSALETGLPWLMALAAGNFIYIAASDLVPELHKEPDNRRAFAAFGIFCFAVLLMGLIRFLAHSSH